MKVLLINPFVTHHCDVHVERISEPLGLLYIAAMCEKYGYVVKVLDMFRYGLENIQNISNDTKRIGLDLEDLRKVVVNFKPNVVGISSMYGAYQDDCLLISEDIKKMTIK